MQTIPHNQDPFCKTNKEAYLIQTQLRETVNYRFILPSKEKGQTPEASS